MCTPAYKFFRSNIVKDVVLLLLTISIPFSIKEIKETDRIKNILAGLKQCDCELIVKETMFLIDVPYSVEGKIIDLDDDWVLIVSMGRKTISRMIRITMIKDVIELTK